MFEYGATHMLHFRFRSSWENDGNQATASRGHSVIDNASHGRLHEDVNATLTVEGIKA